MPDEKLSVAKSGIMQLAEEVKASIRTFESVDTQVRDMSTIINNFVMQTLQVIDNNEDLSDVNQILASSLLQIRNFANERPAGIRDAKLRAVERLSAYEQSIIILNEVDVEAVVENLEEESASETARSRIEKDLDEEGKYTKKSRKPGERPEKLRDVRNTEAEFEASNNFSE